MFLLVERDPFVRTDMCQTLREAFPAAQILSVESLDGADESPRPELVLIDSTSNDPSIIERITAWVAAHTPVILTNATSADGSHQAVSLPRPFTADMLVDVVRAALRKEP